MYIAAGYFANRVFRAVVSVKELIISMLAYGSLADDLTGAVALDLHLSEVTLDVGNVGNGNIFVAVYVGYGLLIIGQSDISAERSLENGHVQDGDIAIPVKVAVRSLSATS